jgi:uncharacterized protein (TIGR02172 family)
MYQIKGKIDSANAPEFEKEIMAALPTEIDAAELEYISSAGLRVMMKLRKAVGDVIVCNVSPEVYEIFDVTGFTSILTVKKALREINLTDKEIIGRGGNGTVYRLDDETIVKLYKPEYPLEKIEREQSYAKAAFVSGIPSVIAYDIVKSGDSYGVVFEAMNSDTLSHAIATDPEHIDEYVGKYVDFVKTIHSTEIIGEEIITLKEFLRSRVSSPDMLLYCEQSEVDVLLGIIDVMKDCNTLVHGDLHPGNIMIQNGELMLIDMGEATRGVPVYDVAAIFRDLLSGPKTQPDVCRMSVGLEPEIAIEIGQKFLMLYSDSQSEEQFQGYLGMLGLVYAFNVVAFIPDIPMNRDQFAPAIVQNLLRPVVLPNAEALKHILS